MWPIGRNIARGDLIVSNHGSYVELFYLMYRSVRASLVTCADFALDFHHNSLLYPMIGKAPHPKYIHLYRNILIILAYRVLLCLKVC